MLWGVQEERAIWPQSYGSNQRVGQDLLCLGLCGCHVRSEGWLGERERHQNHECTIQSCCSQRTDYLGSSLQEGKEMSVKFCGNISSCNGVAVGFFSSTQTYFTTDVLSPFKTGLAYLFRPPHVQFCCCCSIAVVSARKLYHEQQKQRPKFLETGAPGSAHKRHLRCLLVAEP